MITTAPASTVAALNDAIASKAPKTYMENVLMSVVDDILGFAPRECLKCEDGLIESIVPGSESKTETSACSCPRGRERQAEHDGDLESLGADKYGEQQRGRHP